MVYPGRSTILMMKSFPGIIALLHLFQVILCEANGIPVQSDSPCAASQVFDFTGLSCVECGTLSSCKCPPNQLQKDADCSIDSMLQGSCRKVMCSSECAELSYVSSLDQKSCLPCSLRNDTREVGASEYDEDSMMCTCRNPPKGLPTGNRIVSWKLVEIHDEATGLPIRNDCVRCPAGSAVITRNLYDDDREFFLSAGMRFVADPYSCSFCPDPHMYFDTDYNCVCIEGYLLTGEVSVGQQSCIEHLPSVSGSYSKIRFRDPVPAGRKSIDALDLTIDSVIFSHYYLKSASECEYYKGTSQGLQSCQALSNLCVINMYDEEAAACKELEIISQKRAGSSSSTLPRLYYQDAADSVNDDRSIGMRISLHPERNRTHKLSFKLVKYTLNGTFAGIEDLSNQLEYCSETKNILNEPIWLSFGNGYKNEYKCTINDLLETEMFFYDMFIVDESLESCNDASSISGFQCLYPVPILIRNLVEDRAFPNFNVHPLDEYNDKYVRRFFLVDNQVSFKMIEM